MKLTGTLVMVLSVVLSVMLVIEGYAEHGGQRSSIADDMNQTVQDVGRSVAGLFERVSQQSGRERAIDWLEAVEEREVEIVIRWVWLDANPGDPFAPALPSQLVARSIAQRSSIEDPSAEDPALRAYVPARSGEERQGALELSRPLSRLEDRAKRALGRTARLLLGLFLASMLTVVLVGVQLVGRPLQRLKNMAERAGSGDLSEPVRVTGRNELADLAHALNKMCDDLAESRRRVAEETAAKIQAVEMARHSDRLRTVGRLASGVAHELGTPLNVVSGRATLIADDKLRSEDVRTSARIIVSQVHRMTEIVRQLLTFARPRSGTRQSTDLRQIAQIGRVHV